MRLFYRKSYTHHRYMATKDNDMVSLHARLSIPSPTVASTSVTVPLNSSQSTEDLTTVSESTDEALHDDGAADSGEPASTQPGSRNHDELQELEGILQDMGSGSTLYLDLRYALR